MQLTVERKPFLASFLVASSASKPKSTLEIVRNVLLDASGEVATLTATDTNQWLTLPAKGATVQQAGSTLLDAEKVRQALEGMRGEIVTIALAKHQVTLSDGRVRVTLPTDDHRKFPAVPEAAMLPPTWELAGAQVEIVDSRVAYATTDNHKCTALAGVRFEVSQDELGFVALDGRRLVRYAVANAGPKDDVHACISPMTWKLAAKVFGDGKCRVGFTGPSVSRPHMVHFFDDLSRVSGRLLDGNFPNWRTGIPDASARVGTAKVVVAELASAIKVASIATSVESEAIWFSFSEAGIELSGSAADRGIATVPVESSYVGTPFRMRVGGGYLKECFQRIDPASTVEIDLHGEGGLFLVRAEGRYVAGLSPIGDAE